MVVMLNSAGERTETSERASEEDLPGDSSTASPEDRAGGTGEHCESRIAGVYERRSSKRERRCRKEQGMPEDLTGCWELRWSGSAKLNSWPCHAR